MQVLKIRKKLGWRERPQKFLFVRMLLFYGLVFATCCGASLQVAPVFRGQVKVSLQDSDGPYLLEKTTNLSAFAPVSILTNAVILPATEQFAAFRAQDFSGAALSYFERAGVTSP